MAFEGLLRKMAKTYRMPFRGDPDHKLAILKQRAASYGISFSGTTDSGRFSGMGLSGIYRREGDFFVVTISSVPIFYTYDGAAAQIQQFLEE